MKYTLLKFLFFTAWMAPSWAFAVHTVSIQDLTDKNPILVPYKEEGGYHHRLIGPGLRARKEKFNPDNVFYSETNLPSSIDGSLGNFFVESFYQAYIDHRGIILSPDDVWIQIRMMMSSYINDNAEDLRSRFVNHEGKVKLLIEGLGDRPSELGQKEWRAKFFDTMAFLIQQNTKEGIVPLFQANFSTTTPFERNFSTAIIMDSFKEYFSYGFGSITCGVTKVHFMGELKDWTNLREKTLQLAQFSLKENDFWDEYVKKVIPILDEFINTYNNQVNPDFWNNMMTISKEKDCGGTITYFNGWILAFLGKYGAIESYELPNSTFSIPVDLFSNGGTSKKTLTLHGGFTGTFYDSELNAYRPQLGMMLYHFQTKPKKPKW